MPIIGNDVSRWDWMTGDGDYSPIDWARSETVFTFLKACDGVWDGPHYADEIKAARAAGKLASPYCWLYPASHTNIRAQAEFWYSRLKDEPLIVIDFEGYATYFPEASDLYGAIERLKELGYDGTIMIYTGHYYWLAHGNDEPYWLQFPIWLARYSIYPPQDTPPWPTWDIWQFSATGDPSRYGITNGKKAVDENRFEGTLEELAALFGQAVTPPPQEETMNKVTIIASTINVRSGPATSAAILRQLKSGNVIYTPYDVETKPVSGQVWIRISESPVEYVAVGAALSKVEAVPGGGEIKPVITFNFSAEGYPPQAVTWTPS